MRLFDKSYCERQAMLMDVLQGLRAQNYRCERVEDEQTVVVKPQDSSITYLIRIVDSYNVREGVRAYRRKSNLEIQEEAEYIASFLWSRNDDDVRARE